MNEFKASLVSAARHHCKNIYYISLSHIIFLISMLEGTTQREDIKCLTSKQIDSRNKNKGNLTNNKNPR